MDFFFGLFCEKLYIKKKTGLERNLYCTVWITNGFCWSWHFGIGGVSQRSSQLLKIIKYLDDRFKSVNSTSLLLKIKRIAGIKKWTFCKVEINKAFFSRYLFISQIYCIDIILVWTCCDYIGCLHVHDNVKIDVHC